MTDRYKNIDVDNEKVRKIVNAAYQEFSQFGQTKASLNKILEAAGLSKGVFYHYFKDKDELFGFLVFYTIEKSLKAIDESVDWEDDDIIRRISEMSKYKLNFLIEHPYMIEFGDMFRDVMLENPAIKELNTWKDKFYTQNINVERLRDQSSIKDVMHIIRWSYKGIFVNLMMDLNCIDESYISKRIDECDNLYKVLASNFYK